MTNYRSFIVLNIKLPTIYKVNISPDNHCNSQSNTDSLTKSDGKSDKTSHSQCSLEEKKILIIGKEGGRGGRVGQSWDGLVLWVIERRNRQNSQHGLSPDFLNQGKEGGRQGSADI